MNVLNPGQASRKRGLTGDRHAEAVHVGKIQQPDPAAFARLMEDNLPALHRLHQGRAPHWPQLPRAGRERHQRHLGRRLQLLPPAQLVQAAFVATHRRHPKAKAYLDPCPGKLDTSRSEPQRAEHRQRYPTAQSVTDS